MRKTRRSRVGVLVGLLLVFGASVGSGQSAFPMRFDPEPMTSATNVETVRALSSETARHYHKAFTYDADTMNPSVNVLDVTAAADDTVVVIRILVASSESDDSFAQSMRQRTVRVHWDADALGGAGQWTGFLAHNDFDLNGAGQIGISENVAGSGPLEIVVQGANQHDLLTVMIEAVASEDVTFTEFTAST